MTMKIYKSEIDAGLEEKIRASASFNWVGDAVLANESISLADMITVAEANPNQSDLFYLQSILVSVGWNKNDDVFDRFEVWKARSTPVDKPFNYMHNEQDIIGHLTSSYLLNSEGKIIPNDTPFDDLPEFFDIGVGSVLYRDWEDEERQERMNQIIAEIKTGAWKVSMECLFPNFDYAVIAPNGENKMIKRTESSAFLTQHLRIYGGKGEYEGYRLGRLLRDLAFSGKGLVKTPANPRSNILNYSNENDMYSFTAASEIEVDSVTKGEIMADTYTKEQYEFLQNKLETAQADYGSKITEKDAEIKQLQEELKAVKAQKAEADEASKVVLDEAIALRDKEIEDLKKKLDESDAAKAELQEKVNEFEIQALKAARLAKILSRNVSEDNAKALVEKFSSVSDEMFDELVSALPEKVESAEGKSDDDDDEPEEDEEAQAGDIDAVNSAEAEEEDVQSLPKENEEDTVLSKASAWLSGKRGE